jgi:hypothetical protein
VYKAKLASESKIRNNLEEWGIITKEINVTTETSMNFTIVEPSNLGLNHLRYWYESIIEHKTIEMSVEIGAPIRLNFGIRM